MTIEDIEKRKALVNESNTIISNAEKELRKLTEEETKRLEEIKAEITELENKSNNQIKTKKTMETKNFSLINTIRNVVEGRQQDDLSLEVMQKGAEELRKAGVTYKGQITLPFEYRSTLVSASNPAVETSVLDIQTPLYNALTVTKAGATILNGLVGNVVIPTYTGSNVAWKSELDAATDGTGTMGSVDLKPKRLTGYFDVSKMLLAQDSVGVEQMLRNDIVNSIAVAIEKAIFSKIVDDNAPKGFFAGFNADTNFDVAGELSWEKVVELESKVDTSNALMGNLAYITHPSLKGLAKTTPKASNTAVFVAEGNTINGYNLLSTSSMATDITTKNYYGIIFGNWADLLIGQWGGVDIVVDPYTQAGNGKIRIYVNAYFDAKPRRKESFAIGGLKEAEVVPPSTGGN